MLVLVVLLPGCLTNALWQASPPTEWEVDGQYAAVGPGPSGEAAVYMALDHEAWLGPRAFRLDFDPGVELPVLGGVPHEARLYMDMLAGGANHGEGLFTIAYPPLDGSAIMSRDWRASADAPVEVQESVFARHAGPGTAFWRQGVMAPADARGREVTWEQAVELVQRGEAGFWWLGSLEREAVFIPPGLLGCAPPPQVVPNPLGTAAGGIQVIWRAPVRIGDALGPGGGGPGVVDWQHAAIAFRTENQAFASTLAGKLLLTPLALATDCATLCTLGAIADFLGIDLDLEMQFGPEQEGWTRHR